MNSRSLCKHTHFHPPLRQSYRRELFRFVLLSSVAGELREVHPSSLYSLCTWACVYVYEGVCALAWLWRGALRSVCPLHTMVLCVQHEWSCVLQIRVRQLQNGGVGGGGVWEKSSGKNKNSVLFLPVRFTSGCPLLNSLALHLSNE